MEADPIDRRDISVTHGQVTGFKKSSMGRGGLYWGWNAHRAELMDDESHHDKQCDTQPGTAISYKIQERSTALADKSGGSHPVGGGDQDGSDYRQNDDHWP